MSRALRFRPARLEDAVLLTGIARAAKGHWGYPEEWLAAWQEELTLTPGYLDTQPVQVAELQGDAIGFFGLRQAEGGWHLEHLWLLPAHIGRGFGRVLFAEAVARARQEGAQELKIRSDPNAEAFYLKMGAVRAGLEVYQLLGKIRREVPLMVASVVSRK